MVEIVFPEDLEAALMKLHDQFSIDIPEYVVRAVRDDMTISSEIGNDSVLNTMIRESMKEALALLEENQWLKT